MKFGSKDYGKLIIQKGKIISSGDVEIPNDEKINDIETRYCAAGQNQGEMTERFNRKYFTKTELIMRSKLHG